MHGTSDDDEKDSLLDNPREGRRAKDSDVSLPGGDDSSSEDENSYSLPVREPSTAHSPRHPGSADEDSDEPRGAPRIAASVEQIKRSASMSGQRARLRSPHAARRGLPRQNSVPSSDMDPDGNGISPQIAGRDLADVI